MPIALAVRRFASLRLLAAGLALLATPVAGQLGSTGTQFWNQDSPGLGLTRQTGANMGVALATGDFDCDGLDDLAIGMPGDSVSGHADAGDVLVLYSTELGPGTTGRDLLSQDTPGVLDAAEDGDRFGAALAAGDFDHDFCDDLAIGVPGESIEAPAFVSEAGAVNVLYGSVLGLTVANDAFFTQDTPGIVGLAQTGDHFGTALLAADLDEDGIDDLVIGVPDEDIEGTPTIPNAGAVHVLAGAVGGLDGAASVLLAPGGSVLNYVPGDFDRAGAALAAPDFGVNVPPHLAIGIPGRAGDDANEPSAGMVALVADVLSGSPTASYIAEGLSGTPGEPEAFDEFGAALAAGDFDGDGNEELAIGVPGEDLEAVPAESAGVVIVADIFFGNYQLWTQDDLPPEHSDPFDRFGAALAAGDFDADGFDDLAIGVPGESLGALTEAGVVHVVRGSGSGLTTTGRQLWLQTINPSEEGDWFGAALAVGRFQGHSGVDLAIGVPREDLSGTSDTGGVNVLFSDTLFIDGFESGFLCNWTGGC